MDNTPDMNYACPHCDRYTCRCGEAKGVNGLSPVALNRPHEPDAVWAPWMSGQAANA